jgi:hypothetical protein
MIRPYVFFPFSHISNEQLETLLTFLPCFYYFPAASDMKDSEFLQNYVNSGRIIPIFSEKEIIDEVEQTFKNYQDWANIHKGSKIHLKSLIEESPYFISDSDVLAIKSRIRNKNTGEFTFPANKLLQKDLLFLKMAKSYDADQENIDFELSLVGKAGKDMLLGLLGSDIPVNKEEKSEKQSTVYDPGEAMSRERLEAFARCVANLPLIRQSGQSPVCVTTSEAMISYLEIICTNSINTLDINPIKVHEKNCKNQAEWQKQLSDCISFAVEHKNEPINGLPQNKLTEPGDGCSLSGKIKVSLFSGETINDMFNLKDKYLAVCLIRLK